MRKKILYIGLIIFAIAVIAFLVSGALYSNVLSRVVTIVNLTVNSGGFSFAQVEPGNASLIAMYVAASNRTNIYLFNASAFHLWSSYMNGNSSTNGFAYANTLNAHSPSLINGSTTSLQVILAKSQSVPGTNSSFVDLGRFNGTVYVVIDNTKGSYSYNDSLKGIVSYFKLTPANLDTYNKVAMTEIAVILVGVVGIIIAVYGAIKKPPSTESQPDSKSGESEPISKEYIDSLYKNVGKDKGKKKRA